MITRVKKNFTLIELLVVIAIIAILASLLLPSLNKARQRGKLIFCVSNMKQQGQGLLLYAGDNDERLPTHKGLSIASGGVAWDSTWWMWQLIRDYKAPKTCFVCPLNRHNDVSDNSAGWTVGVGVYDSFCKINLGKQCYSMNGRLLRTQPSWKPAGSGTGGMLSRVRTPSRSIMNLEYASAPVFVDGVRDLNNSLSRFQADPTRIRDHFNLGMNFAAVDGHAETLKYTDNPNNMYCEGNPALITQGDWYHGQLWYK